MKENDFNVYFMNNVSDTNTRNIIYLLMAPPSSVGPLVTLNELTMTTSSDGISELAIVLNALEKSQG